MLIVGRRVIGLAAAFVCAAADALRPPAPVHGWTPTPHDYEEQD